MKLNQLDVASRLMLALSERQCFELSPVKSIIIPISVNVIEESNFRNVDIERIAGLEGSQLRCGESKCFAGCSMKTI
jgi:hypothetical protein